MRIAYSALIAMVATAVPSIGMAQDLKPFPSHRNQALDHVVPVATLSPLGEPMALADGRPVQDEPGESFVLGTAILDLREPAHAKIVFAMTNATQMPMPWSTVSLRVVRATLLPDDGGPFFGCQISGRAGHQGDWQPGATVTVELPIAPNGNCLKDRKSEPQAFLVFVQSTGTPRYARQSGQDRAELNRTWNGDKALLRTAFEKLTSPGQH